jgi:starch-binding outer membrane protein, SusD/RagB family
MRKTKLYISIAALLTFSSCGENFLDSEPYTQLSDLNYYKNPEDASSALVGVYDGLQRMYSSAFAMPVVSEILSDNAFGGLGKSDGYGGQLLDEFDPLRSPGDKDIMLDNWKNYYFGIYRCNTLLINLDGVSWGDKESLKNQYAAEARFIRAVAYFDLVRLFENVVLITEPTTENLPQADPDDVYKLIAEDLKFAIENLPAVTYAELPASQHGRVTKWAAEALLARVFLFYTGYYQAADLVGVVSKQEALDNLEDLIQNSGHQLVPDFSTLWPAASLNDYAGERNTENVFNIKYTFTSNYNGDTDGNHWMVMLGVRGGTYPPYGLGWGAASVNPKLWNAYADTDTRKTASIISIADEGIDYDNSDAREYTGYYNKKYTPMADSLGNSLAEKLGGVNFQIGQYQDYIMIRYADVLLMAAELGSANAQAYFDAVRQRAYKDDFSSTPANQANIMNERRLEFAFEGIRYWDLLRQGVSVAAATIAETTNVTSGGVAEVKTITANKIELTRGFQQIPWPQITLSGSTLVQNEGWK